MLYIDKTDINVQNAVDLHYRSIKCIIKKKLGHRTRCADVNCRICNSRIQEVGDCPSQLRPILLDDDILKMLICGDPKELHELDEMIWSEIFPLYTLIDRIDILTKRVSSLSPPEKFFKKYVNRYIEIIGKVIDYDNWFVSASPTDQYSAYHLADNLNRRSCTYCNRTYTSTMISNNGGKLMRPQFDHWYPKSIYPFLALSFYNLIPSCPTCNSSVKSDLVLNLNDHIHPYIDNNQSNEFSFNYMYSNRLNNYRIFIQKTNFNQSKALQTLKKLKIDVMYNAHLDELKDLIKIKQTYSETYIDNIQNLFPRNGLLRDEIYRLLFGTELNSTDFHKRPLSKFKSDILKKLEIID